MSSANWNCFCMFMSLLVVLVQGDNPTAIVKPYEGPDPGYILAESDGGLSNRLRVLAAYMHIGEYKFEGAHLAFVWDVNSACPGHYLEVFQPIPNVVFATNSSRYVLDKNAKIVYENSWAVLHWTLSQNNVPKSKFGSPTWAQIEYNNYAKFKPTAAVMQKVAAFVRKHNICSASAMHLRQTDLSDHLRKKKKAVNLQSYFDFVDERPKDEPVYLLTDNYVSQRLFLDKYGPEKILVFALIPPPPTNATEAAAAMLEEGYQLKGSPDGLKEVDPSTGLPSDHRHTSLEHAVLDVLVAAHARNFKPAMYSSLSDVVQLFSKIGRADRGWCA